MAALIMFREQKRNLENQCIPIRYLFSARMQLLKRVF